MRRGIVNWLWPCSGGDAWVVMVDKAPLDPHRRRVAKKHRHDVNGVRMVLDEVSEEPHRGVPRFTDLTAGDRLAQLAIPIMMATQSSPVECHMISANRICDGVGFGERTAKTLFRVDCAHAMVRAVDDWFCPGERRRRDTHDVGTFAVDHLAVVEVRIGNSEAVREPPETSFASVGNRDDLAIGDRAVRAEMPVRHSEPPCREFILDQPTHPTRPDDGNPPFPCGHAGFLLSCTADQPSGRCTCSLSPLETRCVNRGESCSN